MRHDVEHVRHALERNRLILNILGAQQVANHLGDELNRQGDISAVHHPGCLERKNRHRNAAQHPGERHDFTYKRVRLNRQVDAARQQLLGLHAKQPDKDAAKHQGWQKHSAGTIVPQRQHNQNCIEQRRRRQRAPK
jgi:hypothetical protein